MRPAGLRTRIFLDGGDPKETADIQRTLGFLDGQTPNPTLVGKNPVVKSRLEHGEKFRAQEILAFYQSLVQEIARLLPGGSISVEVYADRTTTAAAMLAQGKTMFSWIPNAHIKFPTTTAGLAAAEQAVADGLRVNLTLCFSQEQAAAVYAATRGATRGQVFVSPFIGRLDDRGEDGMDLIANILRLYREGDGHVQVLTASVRNLEHLLAALHLGSDIITAPAAVLREWASRGLTIPDASYTRAPQTLRPIPYSVISLHRDWRSYNLFHELTDQGLDRFAADWNALIAA